MVVDGVESGSGWQVKLMVVVGDVMGGVVGSVTGGGCWNESGGGCWR